MEKEKYKGRNVIWESKTNQIFIIVICFIFTFLAIWIGDNNLQFWISLILFGLGGILMLIRLLNPRNIFVTADSKIGKEILSNRFEIVQNNNGIFDYIDCGFKIYIKNSNEYQYHNWEDIQAIYGYKVDLMTYDEICVDVFFSDQTKITVSESTSGWFQFVGRLGENIQLIKDDWVVEVANPAFDTNSTVLYEKQPCI